MRRIAALLTVALAIAVLGSPTASAAPKYTDYVALGDSMAAGSGIPSDSGDIACNRSGNDYPALTARALGVQTFTDVSCAKAALIHMTTPQIEAGRPQFDALTAHTDLVTVTMGLNDSSLLPVMAGCGFVGLLFPGGAPCTVLMNLFGFDYAAGLVRVQAPRIGEMLRGIHERSPNAKLLVVGLPTFLPEAPTDCWPNMPFSYGDVPYLSSLFRDLNTMLREQADGNGATFVDTDSSSKGHDMCQPVGQRWIEGLVPTDRAVPAHPNLAGTQNMSAQIVAALHAVA